MPNKLEPAQPLERVFGRIPSQKGHGGTLNGFSLPPFTEAAPPKGSAPFPVSLVRQTFRLLPKGYSSIFPSSKAPPSQICDASIYDRRGVIRTVVLSLVLFPNADSWHPPQAFLLAQHARQAHHLMKSEHSHRITTLAPTLPQAQRAGLTWSIPGIARNKRRAV